MALFTCRQACVLMSMWLLPVLGAQAMEVRGDAPAESAAPPAAAQGLPPVFTPGKQLPFSWWRGKDFISGTMEIEAVHGDWVQMHLLNDTNTVWIYPPAMTAVWGVSMQR